MTLIRQLATIACILLPLAAPHLQAQQQNQPHIGYLYPAGGQKGSTFKMLLGGQFLDGVKSVLVSGGDVSATLIEQTKPLSGKEFQLLRDRIKELQEKRQAAAKVQAGPSAPTGAPAAKPAPFTEEDAKELASIREKIAKNPPRPPNPSIAETVTLSVTLSPDARPGERELRLLTRGGLTNPMKLQIGSLPEFREQKAKTDISPKEMPVTLPAVINGQIMPGDVDRYRFPARRGQQLVVAVVARALIPYLADAVPGWFQATVALYDSKGREVAYDDDYRFNPDPVLSYKIPKDGDYVIEIKDSIYRGRDDFVYRIYAGELPFVTSIFPLGAQAGRTTPVELNGWNLPSGTMTPNVPTPGLEQISMRTGDLVPNRVSYQVGDLPECLEKEPNSTLASAQPLTLPIVVNGRIGEPDDCDIFRFEGKAGQEIVAEVHARRLDSPLDSVLRITDAQGRQLAYNDDHEDKSSGLDTHHADSYLLFKLPADGAYFVHLGDVQHKGGSDYAYRLRLSAPAPAFALRIAPSTVNMRGGSTVPLTFYALRQDGFSGPIAISLAKAPAGFVLAGAIIPAGQNQTRITLTAPLTLGEGSTPLEFSGQAEINGKNMTCRATPAEDMMQAFAYRHLVPVQELYVTLAGRAPARFPLRIISPTPVKIPAGGTCRIRTTVPLEPPRGKNAPAGKITLQLSEPPEGVSLKEVLDSHAGGSEMVILCDAAKAKPGTQGNLIVQVYFTREKEASKDKPSAGKQAQLFNTLPAIPFKIVAPATLREAPH